MRTLCLSLMMALAITTLAAGPAIAQDRAPAPADAEAVKALIQQATRAMVDRDHKTFVACCDDFVDCFFLDGTLIKGKKRIAVTLHEFFIRRPEDFVIRHEVVPRSYRVLSPDIMMVDWPA